MLCKSFEVEEDQNLKVVEKMRGLVKSLKGRVEEEMKNDEVDPNKQLKIESEGLLTDNLVQGLNTALSEILF
mgnify:CR=1 FL=1